MEAEVKLPMRCQHCGNEWDYGGISPFYAACPRCHILVSVQKRIKKLSAEGMQKLTNAFLLQIRKKGIKWNKKE